MVEEEGVHCGWCNTKGLTWFGLREWREGQDVVEVVEAEAMINRNVDQPYPVNIFNVDTHPISLYMKTRLISHFTNSLRFDSDLIDIAHISMSFSSSSYGIMPPCLQTYCSLLSVYWYTFNIILLSFSSATHPRILVFSQFAGTLQPCSSLQSLVLPHL